MFLLFALLLVSGAAWAKPDPAYFGSLEASLREKGVARPVAILDLERVDRNLETIRARLGGRLAFRAVEKSLPSADLLKYVLGRMGSKRVMAFHHPFLPTLLRELPADTDILFGKPIPAEGVRGLLATLKGAERRALSDRVTWLIDTSRRFAEYEDVFRDARLPFRVAVEIDVGLRRGGVSTSAELDALLDRIETVGKVARFVGLMGYDGHASKVPVPKGFKRDAMAWVIRRVEARYREHLARVRARWPGAELILNGGGSTTYVLYGEGTPLNEVAVGSAIVKPTDFDLETLDAHVPAAFVATPVLKRVRHAELPYIGWAQRAWNSLFHPRLDGFYVYGGGWAEEPVHPAGLASSSLTRVTPHRNLVSNQVFLQGEPAEGFDVGSFVFFRPVQGDTIFLFDELLVARGGKITGSWKPFGVRY